MGTSQLAKGCTHLYRALFIIDNRLRIYLMAIDKYRSTNITFGHIRGLQVNANTLYSRM
jgi:hypothetical protein